ncbi:hypothetical protein EBR77_03660 [bacterium]|nr:hypothetical protein [bacterium]NBX77932.1 hypothetical protein [bacterium]
MNNFLLFFIMIGLGAAHIQCMDGEVKSPVENEGAPRTRARTGQAPRPSEAPKAIEAKDAQEQTERSSATTNSLEAKASQTEPSVKQSDKSKDITAQTASQTSADSGTSVSLDLSKVTSRMHQLPDADRTAIQGVLRNLSEDPKLRQEQLNTIAHIEGVKTIINRHWVVQMFTDWFSSSDPKTEALGLDLAKATGLESGKTVQEEQKIYKSAAAAYFKDGKELETLQILQKIGILTPLDIGDFYAENGFADKATEQYLKAISTETNPTNQIIIVLKVFAETNIGTTNYNDYIDRTISWLEKTITENPIVLTQKEQILNQLDATFNKLTFKANTDLDLKRSFNQTKQFMKKYILKAFSTTEENISLQKQQSQGANT